MAIEGTSKAEPTFWFNMAAEKIYGSVDKAAKAAERLQQVIVWIFGVYSSITFAGVIWGKKDDWNPWALLAVGLGFVLLIFSYFQSNKATFPIKQKFSPNSEQDVKNAHSTTVEHIYKHLNRALRLCAFGVFFYCAGILIQFAYPAFSLFNTKKEPQKAQLFGPDSLAFRYKLDEKRPVLHLKLHSTKNSWVKLKLEWDTVIKKKAVTLPVYPEKDAANYERWIYVDSMAVQHFSLPFTPHKVMYLRASRTDTLEKDLSYKTYCIRTKLEFPVKK